MSRGLGDVYKRQDIGCIIGHIKKQDVRILDVEIDHGRADGSGSPSAVFSLRLANRRLHAEMLVSLAGLDCVYAVEEY